MNSLTFTHLKKEDIVELIYFYTENAWPFHGGAPLLPEEIRTRLDTGWYEDDRETFWIEENGKKIGLVIIADVSDTMPLLYDVRLVDDVRGKGYGKKCVAWVTNYVFSQSKKRVRMEAYTEVRNYAMRKSLHDCLFEKEGYLRQSWEKENDRLVDATLYAIIRTDWERGERTSVKKEEIPF
ncbi:GNAT family N-acetyltransferase [Shouchella lonarensis]|uniref:Protein N-acetyltransferase, RimJ/RimL family n=1 Tax=Shouchella lonarensis TaxID=1464122 RepID=A0A1G6MJY0_9BACI|nr:GNAT family protein [Shouchella lonarensis]SDC55275.1 Protein N-acetyltransferase, RimJ/RimL family [Shouchella lonarensis]